MQQTTLEQEEQKARDLAKKIKEDVEGGKIILNAKGVPVLKIEKSDGTWFDFNMQSRKQRAAILKSLPPAARNEINMKNASLRLQLLEQKAKRA